MATPSFTPLFQFAGTGANVSPLPPSQFTSVGLDGPGGLPEFDQLQVLNANITTTTQVQDDGQATTIGSLPNNQYCRATLEVLLSTSSMFMYARSDAYLTNCYVAFVTGPFNDDTMATYGIYCIDGGGSNVPYTWVNAAPITVQHGDIITFAIEGSATGAGKLYFYQNGVEIFSGALNLNPDAALMNTSGVTGLQLDTTSGAPSPADVGVIHFEAGAFSSGAGAGNINTTFAGYGTDVSASSEITTNPAAETNSNRTAIMGTNRGSRIIG